MTNVKPAKQHDRLRTAIYLRTAVASNWSVRDQQTALRKAMRRLALSDKAFLIFKDLGISGMRSDRPGLQSLLKQVRQHKINQVLVTDLSRLSRSPLHLARILKLFQRHRCEILTLNPELYVAFPLSFLGGTHA